MMIRLRVLSTLVLSLVVAAVCPVAMTQETSRPVVLLFETEKTQDFTDAFAQATTRALRNYFRETQRVDVMIFDRESATVQRAMLDKRLTPDSVASYSTIEERVEVAKVLGFDFAAGADLSFESPEDYAAKVLKVKLWLVDVNAGVKGVRDAVGSAIYSNTDDFALDNAMQSAANKAVIVVTSQAFAKLPIINAVEPISSEDSNAIGGMTVPQASQLDADDYSSEADESLNAGDLALAIAEYKRAINADPSNISLRIKLAEAYARKRMFNEAGDTLDRILKLGAYEDVVDAARKKIEKMQNGQATPAFADQEYLNTTEAPQVPGPTASQVIQPRDAASAAVAKMIEGDKLWSKGDPDEAAKSYAESIKLNPGDWRSYERLAIVNASMSLFNTSMKTLDQLKTVQPNPSSQIISNRYEILRKIFDKSFRSLLEQYESDTKDFAAGRITRERYYNTINGLALRSETMANFLDGLVVPPLKQSASIYRSLACGLFAQAASSMLDYLETNSSQSKTNAKTFLDQAKKELETASSLGENKVVVTKEEPQVEIEVAPEPWAEDENGY